MALSKKIERSGYSGLVPIQSLLLLSFMRRYLLELSFSTTGHDSSPWKRFLRNEPLHRATKLILHRSSHGVNTGTKSRFIAGISFRPLFFGE